MCCGAVTHVWCLSSGGRVAVDVSSCWPGAANPLAGVRCRTGMSRAAAAALCGGVSVTEVSVRCPRV